jgi:hypothetical protein
MLRFAIFAAILAGLTTIPGLHEAFAPVVGPAVTEASNPSSRPSRPRRVPPAPTVCRETAVPEPAPSCGP